MSMDHKSSAQTNKTTSKRTELSIQTPFTEEQLRASYIGGIKPLNGPIQIADYDLEWPRLFEREAKRIRAALDDQVLLLEHVGSTSVPGLAAKASLRNNFRSSYQA